MPGTEGAQDAGKLILYKAWYCPFAERALIACKEKKIDFIENEIDPYEKTEEWLSINPNGTVPAITQNGKHLYESSICVEYVNDNYKNDVDLLPLDPYDRAYARLWGDIIGKKIVPFYYKTMRTPEEDDKKKAIEDLLSGIELFSKEIEKREGPFFMGKNLGYVDIMVFPFVYRANAVLGKYRDFKVPQEEKYKAFNRWYTACLETNSVKSILQDHEKLFDAYNSKYTNPKL